jgi:hypothetical protein
MPRFTSHGEVCYEEKSSLGVFHPFWGHVNQYLEGAGAMGCAGCQGGAAAPPSPQFKEIGSWINHVVSNQSDFNEHVKVLTELASRCEVCVELCLWQKPSLPALIAGKPKQIVSIHPAGKGQQWEDAKATKAPETELKFITGQGCLQTTEPFPHDLFFHDLNHEGEIVYADLKRWGPLCRHYIVVHCTDIYGEKGDLGGPGVRHGIRRFIRENPQWTTVMSLKNNYGLMVLSCKEEDKKKVPGAGRLFLNYLKAKAKHTVNGGTYLPLPLVKERFNTCAECEHHSNGRCADCGCWLTILPDDAPIAAGQPGKLWYPTEECPIGKWSAQPDKGVSLTSEQIQEAMEKWDE